MVFWVSKKMDWWPWFDIIASYGNIIFNLITVKIAIYLQVSIFMTFNIFCMCSYYIVTTYKLNKRAMRYFRLSGLQTQTDLNTANIITKQFKTGAFYESLKIRTLIWRIQIVVVGLCATIGYPTKAFWKIR